LIRFLISESGLETLYCLPFEHLDGLYESMGFQICSPNAMIPAKVLEKLAWCNAHYPEPVLLMRRSGGSNVI
jgi:hypothetical protein